MRATPHFDTSRASANRIVDKSVTGEEKAYAFLGPLHYVQKETGSHGRASVVVKAIFPRNPTRVSSGQPRRYAVENRQPNFST